MDELSWAEEPRRASSGPHLGSLIRQARKSRGLTQRELGEACGYSQTAISRIERGVQQVYDVRVLAHLGRQLDLPARLLGLAEPEESPVNRRDFIAAGLASAAAAALPGSPVAPGLRSVAGYRQITGSYRQLDAVVAGRDLSLPVSSHLAFGYRLLDRAPDEASKRDWAAAVAEAAGLAGWLSWDRANFGDARHHYQLAVTTARRSRNSLLSAYMTGSLAQLAIDSGAPAEGITLLASARTQLGPADNATAAAWLSCLEALAHATTGEGHAADQRLEVADAAASRITCEDSPPWPWVFAFDQTKVASYRLTCATLLRQPKAAMAASKAAAPQLAGAHVRQRTMLALDLAESRLLAGDAEQAFGDARRALSDAEAFGSERIAQRARRFRHVAAGRVPPRIMSDFDDALRAMTR